jgi:hypothetical protein
LRYRQVVEEVVQDLALQMMEEEVEVEVEDTTPQPSVFQRCTG